MPWVLIPLAGIMLAGFAILMDYLKKKPVNDAALAARVERNEEALEAAMQRIQNLETVLADSLEEESKPPVLQSHGEDADRIADQVARRAKQGVRRYS